jgi:hypothetical protein
MIDAPTTADEAAKITYGRVDTFRRGTPYTPTRCAYEVSEPPWYIEYHQCNRKPGYGPDGLYCKQHAKRFSND